MKILFIVPYYKPAYVYGGPIVVIALLAENLVALGHEVTVYTSKANGDHEFDMPGGTEVMVDGVKVVYFDRLTKNNTFVSPQLWSTLRKTVKNYDVIHIHSWWNFLAVGAALICKRNGIKPILSPHGMLSDYILQKRNAFAKRWLHNLIGKSLLQNTWVHVSTQMEWEESKKIIPEWQGEIISNLIKLSDREYPKTQHEVFNIGFLSRIDPKKGLDILIKALSKVDLPYQLFVAGSGEADYLAELKTLAQDCGNADKIAWVGWKNGEEKFEFLAQMDLFALTSHSENFAIVVIESLSVGTPVLISNNVGLYSYVNKTGLGCVTDMDVDHIAADIKKLMLDKDKLAMINQQAPLVIKAEYEDVALTNKYLQFYSSVKNR